MKNSCVCFILLLILFYSSFGQIPQTLSYQGVLTDAEGNVITGDQILTFKLYDVEVGGAALWQEIMGVPVDYGVFNVILGSVENPLDLPFNKTYWLGITVSSGAELEPRIQLTASAYSLNSKTVEDSSITSEKIADLTVVRSINTLKDEVTIAAGENISIESMDHTITISASGGGGGGDITSVIAGKGLLGGASSGEAILDVGEGIGVTVTNDSIALDTIFVDSRYINEGQESSITSIMISDGQVLSDDIAEEAVGSFQVLNNSLTANDLAENSVGTSEVSDNSLTVDDLGVNVISSIDGIINDGGDIDLVAGDNVTIIPDEENHQIMISAAAVMNNLDQAYDFGGSGAGRTITADAGAVNIEGSDGLTVNGNVGIGTTNTTNAKLEVLGGGGTAIEISSSGANAIRANSEAGGGYAAGYFSATGEGTYGIWAQSSEYDAVYAHSYGPSSTAVRGVASNGAHAGIFTGGKVGVGLTDPQELLEVGGIVHSVSGGFMFPDGSIQTTAATGNGEPGNYIKKDTPDTSRGTNSIPMLLISNLADGDGINGRSVSGDGISGRSDNKNGTVGWTGASDMSGVFGFSTEGRGVVGRSDNNNGVVGWSGGSDKSGVYGHSEVGAGVTGHSQANSGYGISGLATGTDGRAVYGYASGSNGVGVFGQSDQGMGVDGRSSSVNEWTPAIYGRNAGTGDGVYGWSQNRHGTYGVTYSQDQNHAGVYGINNGAGPAVMADGDLVVNGAFRGNIGPDGGGSFPRPAFNSGWIEAGGGASFTLGVNLYLPSPTYHRNNFVVDMQTEWMGNPGNWGVSGNDPGLDGLYNRGAWYQINQDNSISVRVGDSEADWGITRIRIRVWYIE